MSNDFTPIQGYVSSKPKKPYKEEPEVIKPKPEKESDISKDVWNRLDQWERWGIVLWHDRYNSGNMPIGNRWVKMCKAGTPDRIAFVDVQGTCWIYMIECKAEGKFQSPKQLEFESKFEGMKNVIYEVVYDAKHIDSTLERISQRGELLLKEADKIMNKNS
jgi:hypothetical protein